MAELKIRLTGRPFAFVAPLLAVFALGLAVGFAAARQHPGKPALAAAATYTPTRYLDLAGWAEDRAHEAVPPILASCGVLAHFAPDSVIGTGAVSRPARAWQSACARLAEAAKAHPDDDAFLRDRIAQLFVPYWVGAASGSAGAPLFTGYYETDLNGALAPSARFHVPIYGLPRNLVSADLKAFFPALPAALPREIKGRLVVADDRPRIVPYYTRAEIDQGDALAGQADIVLWADDSVAVHLLHIQGSGRATLPDGSQTRLAYAGDNGRAFHGIAGVLVRAGILKREDATMDHVRDWLESHPADTAAYLNANERYIFFRKVDIASDQGPLGSLVVPLTPERSLAVDPQVIPLGAPVWLETETAEGVPLKRLMSAQDTGAAITGAVRGDVFWGHGDKAFAEAARMRSPGRYAILVPADEALQGK